MPDNTFTCIVKRFAIDFLFLLLLLLVSVFGYTDRSYSRIFFNYILCAFNVCPLEINSKEELK